MERKTMKAKSKSELAMAAGVSLHAGAASQGGEIPVGPLLHRRG